MKNNKKKNILPNPFLYYTVGIFWHLKNRFIINNHYVRNEIRHKKGPYLVLANHTSSNDQIVTGCACNHRMNYVVSEPLYYSNINKLLKIVRAIPKKQFFSSLTEFRKIKEVLNQKGIICIFPHGLCSADGATTTLPYATGKFVKYLGVDVYIIKTNGMYLSNPKWSKIFRRGRVETDCYKLFSKEELVTLKEEEIYNKIEKELDFNDYEWQKEHHIHFKNMDNCKGLENVLYSCPHCKTKFSIVHKDNKLICTNCFNETYLNEEGFIVDKLDENNNTVVKWHRFLIDEIKNQIHVNPTFSYFAETKILKLNKELCKFEEVTFGKLTINEEEILLEDSNNDIIYQVKTSHFFSLPNIPGEYLDLQNNDIIYRCYLKNPKDVSYITDIVIALYENRLNK